MNGHGTPPIWFRANHELVGQVLAAKHARRTDRNRLDSGFTVQRGEVTPLHSTNQESKNGCEAADSHTPASHPDGNRRPL